MPLTLTRDLAFASGQDAANNAMRKAGRTRWNEADRDVAVAVTNRLLLSVSWIDGGLHGLPYEVLLNHVDADVLAAKGIAPGYHLIGHNGGPALDDRRAA